MGLQATFVLLVIGLFFMFLAMVTAYPKGLGDNVFPLLMMWAAFFCFLPAIYRIFVGLARFFMETFTLAFTLV